MLNAYCSGVFPMAESADSTAVFWVDPQLRGIIPLDGFHISRSLKKRIAQGAETYTIDRDFVGVMKACADRSETWINDDIISIYTELHRRGFAHSIEVWADGRMIGGLYGVAINGAFFGESMFSRATDGSKLALVALVMRLKAGGFTLLDTQFLTDHLKSMGGVEISRKAFHKKLDAALSAPADFYSLPDELSSPELRQLSTQMS